MKELRKVSTKYKQYQLTIRELSIPPSKELAAQGGLPSILYEQSIIRIKDNYLISEEIGVLFANSLEEALEDLKMEVDDFDLED
jgi:hypothetical protein